ncbi:hypothetical protein HU200_055342 [Digitaria exilis]|uniref:Uncharacterized protein n=1 Tax=Digitaria exilis TaxID=1010633 RepID=A0A835AFY0_9POAL|nr:hypothetical protein HU200_055342 [Digitaria exilis]
MGRINLILGAMCFHMTMRRLRLFMRSGVGCLPYQTQL